MRDYTFDVERNVTIPGMGKKTVSAKATVKQADVVTDGTGETAKVNVEKTLNEIFNLLPGEPEKKMENLVSAVNDLVVSNKRSEVVAGFGLRQTGDSPIATVRRIVKSFRSMNKAMSDEEIAQFVLNMPGIKDQLEEAGFTIGELKPDVQDAEDGEDEE